MMTWNNMFFQNSNSPIMEQFIFMHNHAMIILIFITILIFYLIINMIFNKNLTRIILENQDIEMVWTLMPTIMLIFIAIPSLQLLYILEDMYMPSLMIKVTGHQWYWSYEYSNFNINFDSFMIPASELNLNSFRMLDTDNHLIIPYQILIQALITSEDVIHAWTIPALGLKLDAVPGRLNQMLFYNFRPGIYFGQCSEICGSNHSFMPISIEVTQLKNFINWINKL